MMKFFLKILLPVFLILAGFGGFQYYKNRPIKMTQKFPQMEVAVVDAVSVKPNNYAATIYAMGTVQADRQVILMPRISGEVTELSANFVQGGVVQKDEILIKLDNLDYLLEVEKAKSNLDKSLADFELEKGKQDIAREEARLISKMIDKNLQPTDLTLRRPQLIQAKASVSEAKVGLKRAKLNLSRTIIRAPFNAMILEKNIDKGSMVNLQGALATLVDINKYQVHAMIPLDRLADFKNGSSAIVSSVYSDVNWEGQVKRTTGQIMDRSRMAGVIIEINDPLGLNSQKRKPQLLIGDHVDIQIIGHEFKNVYSLPRSWIRENNTLWIFKQGKLLIRSIKPLWKEKERILIKDGIEPMDLLITSNIPAPVSGMALKLSFKQ